MRSKPALTRDRPVCPKDRYDPRILEQWTAQIFRACGVPPEHASEAAAVLVRSEVRDYQTHGMTRVASYVERLEYVMRSRALPPMRKYGKLPAELLPTARRQQVPKSRIDNSTGRRPPQDVVFAC